LQIAVFFFSLENESISFSFVVAIRESEYCTDNGQSHKKKAEKKKTRI
jgi:hypothetical protein